MHSSTRRLSTCVNGDYETFRLLWNAKQEPLRRDEFEQGWQAVKTVRVRAIEKVVLTDGYAEEYADRDQRRYNLNSQWMFLSFSSWKRPSTPITPVGRRKPNRTFVLLIMARTRRAGVSGARRRPVPRLDQVKSRQPGK